MDFSLENLGLNPILNLRIENASVHINFVEYGNADSGKRNQTSFM